MQSNLDIDRVVHATAYDNDGDKIGKVGQLYLHDETGEPAWVSINTGLFGTSQSFAPMDGARLEDDDRLVLAVDKATVKDAPRIDDDGHLNEREYKSLYDYYAGRVGGTTYTDRDTTVDRDRVAAGDVDVNRDRDRSRDAKSGDSVVTHEEQLNVGKERVDAGQVRLRKHVVTRNETVTVPVTKEEVEVVREPAGKGDVGRMGDDETAVTLHEERPVVDKEVVAKEKVGLQKNVVTENQKITEQVREEEVDVDRSRDRDLDNKIDINKNGRDDLGRDKR